MKMYWAPMAYGGLTRHHNGPLRWLFWW